MSETTDETSETSTSGAPRPLETGDVLRAAARVLEHEGEASAYAAREPAAPTPDRGEPPLWAREGARSVVHDVHAGIGPADSGVGASLHEALSDYLYARARAPLGGSEAPSPEARAAAARELALDLAWLLADVHEAWGEERDHDGARELAREIGERERVQRERVLAACVRAQAAVIALPPRSAR